MNAHRRAALFALALVLLWRQQALGLATEQFGNKPVTAGFATFTPDLLPVLNDTRRVYWYEVNGDARFYYKGDTDALNALLKRFAAGGKGREVVLHAGPLKLMDLGRTRPIEAHWCVHVPGGIGRAVYPDLGLIMDSGPTVHIHIPSARVKSTATEGQVTKWIADLDSDELNVRENASRELEKQGKGAEAALRKALETTGSAEVKRRVRALLAKLPQLSLDGLAIPEGVRVIGPDELTARCARGLKHKEPVIRGIAADQLSRLEPNRKKAVEGLLKVLKDDGNEYVRRSVASALMREGWAARVALPEIRKFVDDPDVNVKNAFKQAVAAIEKTKEDPAGEESAKLVAAIQKDIAAFLKARAASKSP
jgi:hypothetical protein